MRDLMNQVPVSDRLDCLVADSLNQLRAEQKRKRRQKLFAAAGGAAAVFACAFIFLNVNPALAVRLPVIGVLVDKIEETISYKGDYSDHSNILLPEKEINKLEAGEIVDSPYVQISNGITVAVSEVTYSGQAVYLAMTIHNEAAFPESFYENSVSEEIGYQTLYLECPERNGVDSCLMRVEGCFKDEYTFIGIFRHDTTGFIRGDGSGVSGINYFLKIDAIRGEGPEGEAAAIPRYEGEWNFKVHGELDMNQIRTVKVDAVGVDGFRIKGLIRTPYEIYAEVEAPEGRDAKRCFTVICDANGNRLPLQAETSENYSTYQRDVSKVSVFVCDYEEYMGKLEQGYSAVSDEKTYAQYLSGYALVSAEVTFEAE